MKNIKSVLIIDDDQTTINSLKFILELNEFDVFSANSGEEAFEILQSIVPDVMIVDFNLPGLNGIETAMKIKNMPNHKNIPMIGYSSYTPMFLRRYRNLYSIFVEVITKPVNVNNLVKSVRNFTSDATQKFKDRKSF